jgi:hypothetical protein
MTVLANTLALGTYNSTIWFTNLHDDVVQSRQVSIVVQPLVLNGGFETGDFSYWTPIGDFTFCSVTGNGTYVHSGSYGAEMGPANTLSYLAQTILTTPGQLYLLSFWVISPDGLTPNEFTAAWNGSTIVDQVNLGAIGWTNMHYFVSATAANTVIEFGFRDDPSYLGFDDVSVTPVATPSFQSIAKSSTNLNFSWSSQSGFVYQVQYSTNLAAANWLNLGNPVTASNNTASVSSPIGPDKQRFYRVVVLP